MHKRLVLVAVLALAAAACQSATGATTTHTHADGEEHEHLEVDETPPGEQAYQISDERVGWRRVPLVDVSSVELVDYRTGAAEPFVPVAAPGGLLLLFFGYTSCPDVCPITLADYRAALAELPNELAARTSFGMVSIDPERDSAAIDAYVGGFMDDAHALLADGESALIDATEAFGAQFEIEDHAVGDTDYLVGHSSTVYVIDEDGHIVWELGYPTPPADIIAALEGVFAERY